MGTKTITMYVSDIDGSEIAEGQAYQLSVRLPDGSTQQLDISEENYKALNIEGKGKLLKKRGRKPGSASRATSGSRRRSRRLLRRRGLGGPGDRGGRVSRGPSWGGSSGSARRCRPGGR